MISEQSLDQLQRENQQLRARLEETEDTIRALRAGEVDAVLVGSGCERVFTLETADKPYRLLVDEMPVSAATLTERGEIIHCNRRFASLLQLSQEEVAGRSITSFVAHDCRRLIERMLATGRTRPAECELSLRRADGAPITAYLSIAPRHEGALGECLVVTDLTERRRYEELRRTQEALTVAQARLELAQEAGAIGIFEWNVRTGEVWWSRTAERLYGMPASGFDGSFDAWRRTLHPDDRERTEAEYVRAVEEHRELGTEFRIIRPDGQTRWINAKGTVIVDSAGEPLRLLGVNTDITDQKAAHAERERLFAMERAARAEAERAVQARDKVLAFVAHDLRNPLIGIEMSASTMSSGGTEELRAQCLHMIQRCTGEMRRLIGDLLDVARIEYGRFSILATPLDTRGMLMEVAEAFQPRLAAKGLRLVQEVPASVPPVYVDRGRVMQLLANLLDNALKFTPAGGVIRLGVSSTENFVEIAVTDSGPGLAAADLPYIFERFWKAEPASRAGAGLGLAICKGIVEAHGGEIRAENAPSGGATIRFTLPVARG
ncbi:MAG TPA: ATP-binding protein [Phycisphaerales bacterium]|nr:ATP-binding protein [Phycisphaerales bacterium]